MRYLLTVIGIIITQSLNSQRLWVENSKFYPPKSSIVSKGILINGSSSFLSVEIVKLDTVSSEEKQYRVYHLSIGNYSDSAVCIPLSHWGGQLSKNHVLVLDNPYDEGQMFVTLEDCYHDGYSHYCPSDFVLINPHTYFEINFAIELSRTKYDSFHLDWAVTKDNFFEMSAAKKEKGMGWKRAYKFNHKTIALPE